MLGAALGWELEVAARSARRNRRLALGFFRDVVIFVHGPGTTAAAAAANLSMSRSAFFHLGPDGRVGVMPSPARTEAAPAALERTFAGPGAGTTTIT